MNRTSQPATAPLSRREFLTSAVAIGGGLALSFSLPAQEGGPPRPAGPPAAPRQPSGFLQIAANGAITIITPAVEMGQGGHTGMPMIIMEELGGDWKQLVVKDAAAAPLYNNPLFGQQSTVGSFSVRGWYTELRRIGAGFGHFACLARPAGRQQRARRRDIVEMVHVGGASIAAGAAPVVNTAHRGSAAPSIQRKPR